MSGSYSYPLARRIAGMVRRGHAYLYTDRDLVKAIVTLQESSLYERGLPRFDADLSALRGELETRVEGTGT